MSIENLHPPLLLSKYGMRLARSRLTIGHNCSIISSTNRINNTLDRVKNLSLSRLRPKHGILRKGWWYSTPARGSSYMTQIGLLNTNRSFWLLVIIAIPYTKLKWRDCAMIASDLQNSDIVGARLNLSLVQWSDAYQDADVGGRLTGWHGDRVDESVLLPSCLSMPTYNFANSSYLVRSR